jgi:hypothetical protein
MESACVLLVIFWDLPLGSGCFVVDLRLADSWLLGGFWVLDLPPELYGLTELVPVF